MVKKFYALADEDYAALAEAIHGKLLRPCYFSGTVEVANVNGDTLRLTATLLLYRHIASDPSAYDAHDPIYDVAAVWWDFQCEDEEGIVEEDFDFDRLCDFLIEE